MATLALKPAFPLRTRSSGSKGDRKRRTRDRLHSSPWRSIAITAGAIALTSFCVLAPTFDDPAGRLAALDATPAISTAEAIVRGPSSAGSFEFTPTMLGPALTEDMLTLADEDIAPLIMPELEIRALPPVDDEATPPG